MASPVDPRDDELALALDSAVIGERWPIDFIHVLLMTTALLLSLPALYIHALACNVWQIEW